MQDKTPLKETAVFPLYHEYEAKVIDFGGWALPVHFTSILSEHHAVRNVAGLFDVSHMGEILIEGKDAEFFLNYILTNDVSKIEVNQAQYTAMCFEDGGTVDDLLVYKLEDQKFMLVVNAANTEKDLDWITKHTKGAVTVTDISQKTAQLAIQGPRSLQILQKLTDTDLAKIPSFHFVQGAEVANVPDVLVSRTGYTGEDGFELYLANTRVKELWQKILAAEKEIQPCGLGARDTLRFEARLALYGQELTANITPIEAGIGFTVKPEKAQHFIGETVLAKQKENGPKRKLVGLEILGKGIPRHEHQVFSSTEEEIGFITSGSHSPTLKKLLGLALIDCQYANEGTQLKVKIRNKMIDAVVIKTPFLKR
ncbi:aminomethyltransferase [Natronobacillus azotifigens]|uniref:Aminomethyltransferase n=1 Tax=Natronobacillus azotifigens TaxID=472978 RepID=A0A9J6RDS4_9BACI|nr:glycine cleavage system aminomethyltransferase GcvT [Natronobacillus azotifigens]MCZ0703703.1 glycine cleavage system aminomethyltransferase GcvT [Natronobacillus azotifigens]